MTKVIILDGHVDTRSHHLDHTATVSVHCSLQVLGLRVGLGLGVVVGCSWGERGVVAGLGAGEHLHLP